MFDGYYYSKVGEEYETLKTQAKKSPKKKPNTSTPDYKIKVEDNYIPKTTLIELDGQVIPCISLTSFSKLCNVETDTFRKWLNRNKIGSRTSLKITKMIYGEDKGKIVYPLEYAKMFKVLYTIANVTKGKELDPEIKNLFNVLDSMEMRKRQNSPPLPNFPSYRDFIKKEALIRELCCTDKLSK